MIRYYIRSSLGISDGSIYTNTAAVCSGCDQILMITNDDRDPLDLSKVRDCYTCQKNKT